jgi:hypothetical protein
VTRLPRILGLAWFAVVIAALAIRQARRRPEPCTRPHVIPFDVSMPDDPRYLIRRPEPEIQPPDAHTWELFTYCGSLTDGPWTITGSR